MCCGRGRTQQGPSQLKAGDKQFECLPSNGSILRSTGSKGSVPRLTTQTNRRHMSTTGGTFTDVLVSSLLTLLDTSLCIAQTPPCSLDVSSSASAPSGVLARCSLPAAAAHATRTKYANIVVKSSTLIIWREWLCKKGEGLCKKLVVLCKNIALWKNGQVLYKREKFCVRGIP